MWGKFKSGFSTKEAKEVMNEANAPMDTTQQQPAAQPAAPVVEQPAPVAEQPAPAAQPAAPVVEQPAPAAQPAAPEVQPGDIQQPTNVA
jgi:starch synthase